MLEIAVRRARKTKKELDARKAFSIADRAKKKKVIHKNKAARIKSKIAKLVALPNKPKKQDTPRKNAAKK